MIIFGQPVAFDANQTAPEIASEIQSRIAALGMINQGSPR
jgi:hypothetical protein